MLLTLSNLMEYITNDILGHVFCSGIHFKSNPNTVNDTVIHGCDTHSLIKGIGFCGDPREPGPVTILSVRWMLVPPCDSLQNSVLRRNHNDHDSVTKGFERC